jgi:hypothetical protein
MNGCASSEARDHRSTTAGLIHCAHAKQALWFDQTILDFAETTCQSFPFSGVGVLVDVLRFFPVFPGVPHG